MTSSSMSVVIPAAGEGRRLQRKGPKAAVRLCGEPMLTHSIRPFLTIPPLEELVVVQPPGTSFKTRVEGHLSDTEKLRFVDGGASRLASVRNGMNALGDRCDVTLVHDAARPLVTQDVILRVFEKTVEAGAAIPVLSIPDTVKRVRDEFVRETVDRDELYRAQTPQGMRRSYYEEGLEQLAGDHDRAATLTDDADVVQEAGYDVRTVEGDPQNFKVTYPDDLRRAERIIECTE